ncbi:MAG: hypothetical protein Q9226_002912 [Calogaya cf. arnoldii]
MSFFDDQITAHWSSFPGGTCCEPSPQQLPTLQHSLAGGTIFHHLRHNQFGAGWAATGLANSDIIDCISAPILRVFGPGTEDVDSDAVYNPPWAEEIQGTPQNVVFAATWIDLRERFPPDSAGSRYFAWQGMKGAVWGRYTWSVGSNGVPFPKTRKRREEGRVLDR